MNKIFERIIEAENIINDLYSDVNVDVEYCTFNKKEILEQLAKTEKEIAKIISLNKMNYKEFWADRKKVLTQ